MINEGTEYSAGIGGSELPSDPLERCVVLDKQSAYKSYTAWFQLPTDQRDQLLKTSLSEGAKIDTEFYRLVSQDKLPSRLDFVFRNFEVLSSPAAAKVLLPSSEDPLTNQEVSNDYRDSRAAYYRFLDLADELDGQSGIRIEKEETDTRNPGVIVANRFTVNEMVEVVKKLRTVIPDKDHRIYRPLTLLHPFKHLDVLLDPELRDFVWESFVLDDDFKTLSNILIQHYYPSAAVFDLAFDKYPNKYGPNNEKWDFTDPAGNERIPVPASAFYWALIRRAANLRVPKEEEKHFRNPQFEKQEVIDEIRDKVADYLLDDEFTRRTLQYFDVDELYDDLLVYPHVAGIIFRKGLEATGNEARKAKQEKFVEVLDVAEKHLQGKGDQQRVDQLREKRKTWADILTS